MHVASRSKYGVDGTWMTAARVELGELEVGVSSTTPRPCLQTAVLHVYLEQDTIFTPSQNYYGAKTLTNGQKSSNQAQVAFAPVGLQL